MSLYALFVLGFTVAAIIGIAWTLGRQGHGEFSSDHAFIGDRPRDWQLRAPGGRLGGPGQAGQAVVGPGRIAPANPDGRS